MKQKNIIYVVAGIILIIIFGKSVGLFASYKTGYDTNEICQAAKTYYSQFCGLDQDWDCKWAGDVLGVDHPYIIHMTDCPSVFGSGTSREPDYFDINGFLECDGEWHSSGIKGGYCVESDEPPEIPEIPEIPEGDFLKKIYTYVLTKNG